MAQETKTNTPAKVSIQESNKKGNSFPLDKINFIMIAACIVLIVIGLALMGGSSNTGTTFNEDIFNTRRTVVGPTITLAGFVLMIFAIIFKKKNKKEEQD